MAAWADNRHSSAWVRRVLLVVLFAISFGYVEAAVVVYLRTIYDPIRASLHPDRPAESLLPLITLDELREEDPLHEKRLGIELGRELAALTMLAVVATLGRRRRGEWLGLFMIAFGVWDIVYYLGLKAMIDFPASLLTWDILFLLPVPWLGPVLAPVIVSVSMIGAGLVLLDRCGRGRPLRAGWGHWCGIVLGGLIIIISFCKDWALTSTGGLPQPYNWYLFAAGEVVGLTAFGHALNSRACRTGAGFE